MNRTRTPMCKRTAQTANYYHWAARPVRLRRMSYVQAGDTKPNGLWFDIDEEWKHWCERVRFRLETFRYRHEVKILDDSRILFLPSAEDIDAFTETYGRDFSSRLRIIQDPADVEAFSRAYGRDLWAEKRRQFASFILWQEVAERYSGIIVAPYCRARSHTYLWYYGWHCASGCIWDTSIIHLGKPRRIAVA